MLPKTPSTAGCIQTEAKNIVRCCIQSDTTEEKGSVQDKECLLLWPSPRKERAGCWQREKSKICLRWNMNWLPEKCLGKRKLSQSPETTELKIPVTRKPKFHRSFANHTRPGRRAALKTPTNLSAFSFPREPTFALSLKGKLMKRLKS